MAGQDPAVLTAAQEAHDAAVVRHRNEQTPESRAACLAAGRVFARAIAARDVAECMALQNEGRAR